MFGIRCARCGRIHYTDDTMQRIVTYSGKRTALVCRDDRNCRERRKTDAMSQLVSQLSPACRINSRQLCARD